MNKMQKTPRPIHEIVAEISKSTLKKHAFRYVFVEGVDDVAIYSEIARKKDLKTKLTFEQQGGRIQLLKLYETIKANSAVLNRTLFFADQDTYVFDAVPTGYDYKNLLRGKILFELLLCISFDREKGIHHKNREAFWNNSIIMGLRNSGSNCSRILTVFQNNINQ